jgi:SAM-dependent methyltransferase
MKHHFGYTNIDAAETLRIPQSASFLFKAFVAVPHYQEQGRLLDVGCGAGQKLLEFKSLGWDVRGIELSQQAANEGRKMGLEIATTGLSEIPWPADYFSAITFYHSLEHLPSPRLALGEAFRLMGTGGELLVVVPNFGCLERKLFGRNWGWLDVPVHFYHFTKATLNRIISEAGFRIETVGFSPFGGSANASFLDRSPITRGLSDKAVRLFGVACAAAGSGKALIVSARK